MPACAIPTTPPSMKSSPISPRLLSYLFNSLSYSPLHASALTSNTINSSSLLPRKWHLRRILRSDNPADINAELTGTATFHHLRQNNHDNEKPKHRQMVYKEEGEMPSSVPGMGGMKWTKKYIWRLNSSTQNPEDRGEELDSPEEDASGGISIWFVKITSGGERNQEKEQQQQEEEEEEADYLFHEFQFVFQQQQQQKQQQQTTETTKPVFQPPIPPPLTSLTLKETYPETEVIQATGDHLCVKDMYYTAYSFRIVPETGEVLSWASRHIVKGPKKNQDILNLYSIEG